MKYHGHDSKIRDLLGECGLKQHIADKDVSGWTGVHGWNLQCDDGEVFGLFWGHSEGQFGIRLEYVCTYETKKQAFVWLDTFEIQSYL